MFGSLNCPAPKALDFGSHKPAMDPVGPQQNVKQLGQLKKPSKPQFAGTMGWKTPGLLPRCTEVLGLQRGDSFCWRHESS